MSYRRDLLHGWTEISSTRSRKLSFSSPLPTTPQEKNPKVPGTLGQALFDTLLMKWSFELSEQELSAHTTSPLLFRPLMWNPGFPGKVREAAAAGSGQAISPCYLKYPPCTFNYTLSRPCQHPPPSPTQSRCCDPNSCTCLCSELDLSEPSVCLKTSVFPVSD